MANVYNVFDIKAICMEIFSRRTLSALSKNHQSNALLLIQSVIALFVGFMSDSLLGFGFSDLSVFCVFIVRKILPTAIVGRICV